VIVSEEMQALEVSSPRGSIGASIRMKMRCDEALCTLSSRERVGVRAISERRGTFKDPSPLPEGEGKECCLLLQTLRA
jgi:hypothetical protein